MIRECGPSDREKILSYAYRQEAENMFIIESFNGTRPFGENRYFGAFEGGEMKGLAVSFDLWGSFIAHGEEETVQALVDFIVPLSLPLKAIPAFRRFAEPAVDRFRAHGFIPRRLEPSLVLLLSPQAFRPAESQAVPACPEDVVALMVLQRILHRQPLADPFTEAERQRAVPGKTFVMHEEGRVVAKAILAGRSLHYGQIGGVVTHPDFRRRGYGRRCVSALCKKCFDAGIEKMILFTAEENIPAQRLYQSLGFAMVDRYLLAEY